MSLFFFILLVIFNDFYQWRVFSVYRDFCFQFWWVFSGENLEFWSYALSKFLHVTYLFPDLYNAAAVKLFCAIKQRVSCGVWRCKNGINRH